MNILKFDFKKYFKNLRNKYRLVVMNENTLEERLSFRLSKLNVFIAIGMLSIILIFLTTFIIAFTPLRNYIPGYADVKIVRGLREMKIKTDSLEATLRQKDLYIVNIKNIVEGNPILEKLPEKPNETQNYKDVSDKKSGKDSLFRLDIEKDDKYNIVSTSNNNQSAVTYNSISNILFFTPIKGTITNNYDALSNHFGIDVASKKNEAIKATLDGTVIISSWTLQTGYVIAIQHSNNLISIYKHNSVLLKPLGSFVKAGEVIAIIGESGEQQNGPHLHFELWYNGNPVNPREYIIF